MQQYFFQSGKVKTIFANSQRYVLGDFSFSAFQTIYLFFLVLIKLHGTLDFWLFKNNAFL